MRAWQTAPTSMGRQQSMGSPHGVGRAGPRADKHRVMMYIRCMSTFDHDTDRIGEVVRQAALLAIRHFLNRDELSVSAMEVLHTLNVEGPTRLTTLAEAIHVSQPSMTQ